MTMCTDCTFVAHCTSGERYIAQKNGFCERRKERPVTDPIRTLLDMEAQNAYIEEWDRNFADCESYMGYA